MLKHLLQRRKGSKGAPARQERLCTALICADGQGMTLQCADGSEVRVEFAAAARAYHAAERQSSRKCVGDRDVTAKRFSFPGEIRITLQLNTLEEFNQVRAVIQQSGYSTFDLT